jgi:uncharacterized repeat protein (TIGR02543 family)
MAGKIFFTLLLLLSVPLHLNAAPVELPRTGLSSCYDVTTGALLQSCAGTGQDGEHAFGAAWPNPRFTDNGATVTDNLTGLTWLKDAYCPDIQPTLPNTGLNWLDALDAAKVPPGKCGLSPTDPGGWRLPNVSEMESLIDISHTIPPLPAGAPFVNFVNNIDGITGPFTYWTSTQEAVFSTNAISVATFDGTVRGATRSTLQRIWPVRGTSTTIPQSGQQTCRNPADGTVIACPAGADGALKEGVAWPTPRFIDNVKSDLTPDGTITDTLTGLTWLKKADCFGATATAQLALTAANTLASPACNLSDGSVAGKWRLPNRNEMRSIIDYEQQDGAAWLATQGFTNPQSGWYWTSDSFPGFPIWWMVKTEGGVWRSDTVAAEGGTIVGGVQTAPPLTLLLPVRNTEQFITFSNSAPVTFAPGKTIDLSALATGGGSGNPVTFARVSGPGSLSGANGATLTTTGAGSIVVTASQAGLGGYLPAADVQSTIIVNKANASVTLSPLNQSYTGGARSVTATTTPAGKNVAVTYDGNPAAPIEPGFYAVVATISDADYTGSATGTLNVSKATPVLTWSAPAAILSGVALSATQLSATASVAGTFAYNPAIGAVPPVGIQTLSVTFTPTDTAHYTSKTATVLLTVTQSQAYKVTFASDVNGSLTGNLSQTVAAGASTTSVSAVPAAGYHFTQWTGTGGFSSTSNPLILSNVVASQSLTANFSLNSYTVTTSTPSGNGTIICSSPVNYGANSVCTSTPSSGYHLLTLTDNGADRMSANSGSFYTISGVTDNHAVIATFGRPNGVVIQANGKTTPDLRDALAVLNMVMGVTPTTAADVARADIAPLGADGKPLGNNRLDVYDVIGILRMLLGLM